MQLDEQLREIKMAYMDVFSSVKGKQVLDDIMDQGFMNISIESDNQIRMNVREGRRQLAILIKDLALSPMPEPEEDNSNKENS